MNDRMDWMLYPKKEGSPMHPDEFDWECDCEKCQRKYEAQLERWRAFHGVERQK